MAEEIAGLPHPRVGFHASQEQIPPSQLLRDVQLAEQVGFDAAMSSDHFMPWSTRQGHSGFTLAWLGAALATTSFSLGAVTAPGQRHHPAVVAQAYATLAEMFPGRVWAALGAGQAMNEHITGDPWPDRETRRRRLAECADIIRRLHRGERVSHDGLVRVDDAVLYDLPTDPVPLYAACITVESAQRAAEWAEGVITLNQPDHAERDVLQAYREAGGVGPAMLQVHLSWAETRAEAEALAHDQWRTNVFGPPVDQDLPSPEHFDAVAEDVPLARVREAVRISESPQWHLEHLVEDVEAGFDTLYLHHVGQDQRPWLDTAGEHVLPGLRSG
ncbi:MULTISPECIES: TIGR03885 family FMN-dependent LLM class oxidoreductase [unclassified Nesterenkonia]|uniref:TIGR03885 family FMN-dependent LLM class oxidoreductase n=1 Tax=unclassified Nesterenkonia TaxID=2629769 RepID=UPI0008727286|nr:MULTISPECIES: TIGR03885 family FMN-dependent LLM class oxidoreductase [unclassified Nesterenkonia]MDS2173778.1 TIGR03885 family FMN-dependent LLM class oxidoreductase [Nesterenkonia sp. CL21]OSM44321.1 LLM class F420-dependent oxidoreductase [Nesterenkonia sp. PF2B19]